MRYSTIISVSDLQEQYNSGDWVIIDCRFSLENSSYGYYAYQNGHIPGAIFADLEKDLTGEIIPGVTGRHPLPQIPVLTTRLSEWGIDESVQVVVYDDKSGAFAARLWWLLHWLGHESVAVLDGGWQEWLKSGLPVQHNVKQNTSKRFSVHHKAGLTMETEQILQIINDREWLLVDARTSERYLGENEPIDPVAGHIPSAISIPYGLNLTEDGVYKKQSELRKMYVSMVDEHPSGKIIMYCGSGITAAMNVLAMKHAGLGMSRLYPGSWSEWITDQNRPVAKKNV